MSPGTSSAVGNSCSRPSRITAAVDGNLFLNVLHRVSCLEFHQEIQEHAEQYDCDDDQPADVLSECKRYAAGNDQDDHERISEETEKTEQSSETGLPDQAVRAVEDAIAGGLLRSSAPPALRVVVAAAPGEADPRSLGETLLVFPPAAPPVAAALSYESTAQESISYPRRNVVQL